MAVAVRRCEARKRGRQTDLAFITIHDETTVDVVMDDLSMPIVRASMKGGPRDNGGSSVRALIMNGTKLWLYFQSVCS